ARCLMALSLAGTQPLGLGEERATEPASELVPALDPLARLGSKALGVGRRIALVVDPPLELRFRHLGMELDAPARMAEAKRLQAGVIARECDRAVREPVRVGVPLERLEASRQRPENAIFDRVVRQLDLVPADLGLFERPGPRARRLREQLRPEADAERGRAALEQVGEPALLLA